MLDTLHRVETPEGVRLSLRPAGPVPRALAWSVDLTIRSTLYLTIGFSTLLVVPDLAGAVTVLAVFAGEWSYPVLFEVLRDGRTPGKASVGLRVVNDDGTPVTWSGSILRNLLLAADVLPGSYLAGLVSMLTSRDFRRLGDHAAGTLVVHSGPSESVGGGVPESLAPLAPPVALELAEQRALIDFAMRAEGLSPARADELAALATPLHGGQPARERLARMGAWLMGRRDGTAP